VKTPIRLGQALKHPSLNWRFRFRPTYRDLFTAAFMISENVPKRIAFVIPT